MSDMLSRNRLRLPSGEKVSSAQDYLNYITEILLKQRAMSPKEIAISLQKSTKQIHRYLNALMGNKKIVKIEGSSKYKLISSNMTKSQVDIQRKIETMSEFYESETVKRFLKKATMKETTRNNMLVFIGRICTGQRFKEFKSHPDNWIYPDTFELLVELEKKEKSNILNKNFRAFLRAWLENGMGISVEANGTDLRKMGLDNDKPKPKSHRLDMKKDRYDALKKLTKNDILTICKFGFRYWTFCRPSVMYIVKTDDLIFYDRTVKYIEIDDEKISDLKTVKLLQEKYPVKILKHRACMMRDLKEYKTDESYIKYIYDEEIVQKLESYIDQRKKSGYLYLFWDNNDTNFTFENYDSIVRNEVDKDNKIFKKLFLEIGFKKEDFGDNFRANYALRHFGVQTWLQATDYDYGLIASMGWKDINTLKDWYGGYTAEHFETKIGGVMF